MYPSSSTAEKIVADDKAYARWIWSLLGQYGLDTKELDVYVEELEVIASIVSKTIVKLEEI